MPTFGRREGGRPRPEYSDEESVTHPAPGTDTLALAAPILLMTSFIRFVVELSCDLTTLLPIAPEQALLLCQQLV